MIFNTDENKLKIREVGNDLMGTCKTLDEVINDVFGDEVSLEDIHLELLNELDDIVMCCTICGWWVDPSEVNDATVCVDCEEN